MTGRGRRPGATHARVHVLIALGGAAAALLLVGSCLRGGAWGASSRQYWLTFGFATSPLWALAVIWSVIAWRGARADDRRSRGRCPSCGYDLTGNVSGVCPECGTNVPG